MRWIPDKVKEHGDFFLTEPEKFPLLLFRVFLSKPPPSSHKRIQNAFFFRMYRADHLILFPVPQRHNVVSKCNCNLILQENVSRFCETPWVFDKNTDASTWKFTARCNRTRQMHTICSVGFEYIDVRKLLTSSNHFAVKIQSSKVWRDKSSKLNWKPIGVERIIAKRRRKGTIQKLVLWLRSPHFTFQSKYCHRLMIAPQHMTFLQTPRCGFCCCHYLKPEHRVLKSRCHERRKQQDFRKIACL